jgi:hypothetical protein
VVRYRESDIKRLGPKRPEPSFEFVDEDVQPAGPVKKKKAFGGFDGSQTPVSTTLLIDRDWLAQEGADG